MEKGRVLLDDVYSTYGILGHYVACGVVSGIGVVVEASVDVGVVAVDDVVAAAVVVAAAAVAAPQRFQHLIVVLLPPEGKWGHRRAQNTYLPRTYNGPLKLAWKYQIRMVSVLLCPDIPLRSSLGTSCNQERIPL